MLPGLMVDVILVTTEEGMGKGDRELVGGGGQREIVSLLELLLVVMLLEGDLIVHL